MTGLHEYVCKKSLQSIAGDTIIERNGGGFTPNASGPGTLRFSRWVSIQDH